MTEQIHVHRLVPLLYNMCILIQHSYIVGKIKISGHIGLTHGCRQDCFAGGVVQTYGPQLNILVLHVDKHPTVVEKLTASLLNFSGMR